MYLYLAPFPTLSLFLSLSVSLSLCFSLCFSLSVPLSLCFSLSLSYISLCTGKLYDIFTIILLTTSLFLASSLTHSLSPYISFFFLLGDNTFYHFLQWLIFILHSIHHHYQFTPLILKSHRNSSSYLVIS